MAIFAAELSLDVYLTFVQCGSTHQTTDIVSHLQRPEQSFSSTQTEKNFVVKERTQQRGVGPQPEVHNSVQGIVQ